MKIPFRFLEFAGNNSGDLFKQFQDYFNQYRTEVLGHKGLSFASKNSAGEIVTLAEKEELINDAIMDLICAKSNVVNFADFKPEVMASNPMFQWAAFAVMGSMVDVVLPSVIQSSSLSFITEVKNGVYGEAFNFNVKSKDLFVVSKGSFGKRHGFVQKQYGSQITIEVEERDITVETSLFRVLTREESPAEFVMKAIQSLENQIGIDIYTVFDTAMDNLPTTPTDGELNITGYTQDDLMLMGSRVSAFNGNVPVMIVGTKLALSKVVPSGTAYRYDIQSDFVKVGHVKEFADMAVVELQQYADWTTPHKTVIDDNVLYILPAGKPVKLCFGGALMTISDAPYANADLTQKTIMKKAYGVGIATTQVAGKIALS